MIIYVVNKVSQKQPGQQFQVFGKLLNRCLATNVVGVVVTPIRTGRVVGGGQRRPLPP